MNILIFGKKGQLGWELVSQAGAGKISTAACDLPECDIREKNEVETIFSENDFSLAINASAYTAVDQAEEEVEEAFAVNREGVSNLAKACSKFGVPLIHISTDYVFDGRKKQPYHESDLVSPLGVYGHSKAAGELEVRKILPPHIIVRTSWLYGTHGSNFLKTVLRLGKGHQTIPVVADQFGCPTAARDLAGAILTIASALQRDQRWGTFHYCGAGATTWYEFARKIIELANRYDLYPARIEPVSTEEYPTAARRPRYSVLDCSHIEKEFGIKPRPWQESLAETVESLLG